MITSNKHSLKKDFISHTLIRPYLTKTNVSVLVE